MRAEFQPQTNARATRLRCQTVTYKHAQATPMPGHGRIQPPTDARDRSARTPIMAPRILKFPEPDPHVRGALWFDPATPGRSRYRICICLGEVWKDGVGDTPEAAMKDAMKK